MFCFKAAFADHIISLDT